MLGKITLSLMLAMVAATPVFAQSERSSVMERRGAVIAACQESGDSQGVCACAFDEWTEGLADPSSASANAFADLLLLPDGESPPPSTLSAGMGEMGRFSQAIMSCSDMSSMAAAAQPSPPDMDAGSEKPVAPATKTGASRQPVFMNGADVSTEEKRFAWRDAAFAELNETPVRDTPVPAFEEAHKAYCMANRNDVAYCTCSWSSLVTTLSGRDDVPARIAAYMSSVPPSDIAGVSPEERKSGGDLFADYLAAKACN